MSNRTDSFFSKKRNVILTAVFYTFLWGCAFPLVKLCMQNFSIADGDQASKCLVAGIRFFLSGCLLCAVNFGRKSDRQPFDKKALWWILAYGVLSTALQYSFTYIGLSNIEGSKGAVYDQLCVFMIVIAGGLFFKDDTLTLWKVIGCLIGFVGVFLTSAEEAGGFSFSLGGEGMMLCAALCQTVAYFIAKRTAGSVNAVHLVGLGQLIGGFLLTVAALIAGGELSGVSTAGVVILLALAGISAAAYSLSVMPLKYFPASEIASFNLLIPLFGVIMSGIVLKENIFRLNYLAAILLIVCGIMIINGFSLKKQK